MEIFVSGLYQKGFGVLQDYSSSTIRLFGPEHLHDLRIAIIQRQCEIRSILLVTKIIYI